EAVVMRVHYVQRHLHGVESELMTLRGRQHLQMDGGTLVARKADVADFSRLLSLKHRFHGAAGREDAVRIVHADDLVELQKIDVAGLEPAQRFFNLLRSGLLIAAVYFGHQECALAIAVAQRLAHAKLALSAVVVPAVVEKVNSLIDGRAHDANTLRLFEVWPDKMVSAQPYHRDHFLCVAESTAGNFSHGLSSFRKPRCAGEHRSASSRFQELSSHGIERHIALPSTLGTRRLCRDLLRPQNLAQQKHVGEQG